MKTRTLKIITGILTAVTTLALLDFGGGGGPESEVHLQCPSLVYANVSNRFANASIMPDEDEEEAERRAEEADTEEEAGFVRTSNPEVFNHSNNSI